MVARKKTAIPKIIESVYTPMFKSINLIVETKYELNYISIRRKIQKLNFFKLIEIERNKTFKNKYGFEFPKFNIWKKYCNWFNLKFNKVNDNE